MGQFLINSEKFMYVRGYIISIIIMNCRIATAVEFIAKLGFKQHDLIMTKEQLVLTRIKKIFAIGKMIQQYFVLGYRVDLYFFEHKLPIEIDEKGYKDRNEGNKRQEALEKLDCNFIRINPDKEKFEMDIHISKIQNHIVELSKNLAEIFLIDNILRRLSDLKF